MFVFVNKSLVKLSQQFFFRDLKFLNNHYRFLHWQSLNYLIIILFFLSAEFSVTLYTTEIHQVTIDVDIDL